MPSSGTVQFITRHVALHTLQDDGDSEAYSRLIGRCDSDHVNFAPFLKLDGGKFPPSLELFAQ